jgi:hypothetical protein
MSTSDTTNALLTQNEQLALYQGTGRGAGIEGYTVYPRSTAYGEFKVESVFGTRTQALAHEGSLWIGTNTPGTPILDTAALTAYSATTPTMVLFNNNTVASGINIIPLRFKVQATAAGTNGTNWLGQWILDTGKRYTSGGTALTLTSPNTNVATSKTGVQAWFGAITAPAANASRIVHSAGYRTVIKVIGDVTAFEFGGTVGHAVGMPMEGTLQLSQVVNVPAIIIPPQCSLLWHEYAASQSVSASFDYIQLEYAER